MGSQNDSIKRVKMTLYRCQPKRSQNESLEGVTSGQENDFFKASFSYVADIGDDHCLWLLMNKILCEFSP